MEVYLLTQRSRDFGGHAKNLGIFSTEEKLEQFVYDHFNNKYRIERKNNAYLLSSYMTELVCQITKFTLDDNDCC